MYLIIYHFTTSLADESDHDDKNENADKKFKHKRQVVKSSFASAFNSIINKKVDDSTI